MDVLRRIRRVRRFALIGAALVLASAGSVHAHPAIAVPAKPSATAHSQAAAGSAAVAGSTRTTVVAFCDVSASTPHEAAILELAAMGIAGGRAGGMCTS